MERSEQGRARWFGSRASDGVRKPWRPPSFHSSSPFCFGPRQQLRVGVSWRQIGGIFAPRSLQPLGVLGHLLQRSGHHLSALVEEHAWAQLDDPKPPPHPAVSTSAVILPLTVTLEKMGPQRLLVPAACGPHGRLSLQLFVSWFVSLSSGRLPVLRQSPLPL